MDKKIEISDDGNYHNSNDNGNNLQGLENSIQPLNRWILPPPPLHIRNTNTNNNAKTNIPKSNQCENKNYRKKIIELHRKLIFLNENESSSNISTEEIEGTTDMQLLTSDEGSLSHQGNDNEPYGLDLVLVERKTEPSRCLPDTGFHIVLSTNEIVDVTTKEDDTQKTNPIIRQKKTSKPKKAVASRKLISLNENESSSNISTEEIEGTTDMQLLTSDEGSLSHQGNDNEPYGLDLVLVERKTEPSRCLRDTGFHIGLSTNEIVDVTTKEDNTQKTNPIIRQKKTSKPKKAVASRKLISLNENESSSNISTEEIEGTTDMQLLTSDEGSLSHQGNDNEPYGLDLVLVERKTEPSRCLRDTGFHIVLSTNEIVDVTTKEDNTQKTNPIIRQKKTSKPKKAVASRKLISLNENESSSNISTEEIEGTTDMQLLTSDEGSLSHQGNDNEPYGLDLVLVERKTEPSRCLRDTGFHIVLSTNEIVDVTTKEDNTQKTNPIIRQKKTSKPKKAVASRKLISFNENESSSNISTEEIEGTTDMQLLTSDEGSLSHQGNDNEPYGLDLVLVERKTEPSRCLRDTGFHIGLSTNEIVDVTTKEDNTQKTNPIIRQKKTSKPKKAVASRKLISLNENESSSNISTEEIEGTTDMQLLTSDEGSLSHQGNDNEPYGLDLVLVERKTEPSRCLRDTGFHIVLSTNEIVDVTTKEDNTQKTNPIIRQKKTSKPKKAVASRKLISFNENESSSNISTEEIEGTTDMQLLTSDEGSLSHQGNDNEPYGLDLVLVERKTEPSRCLRDTGFHIGLSTNEIVDVTTKEDNTQKTNPIIRQKKTSKPKKAVASRSDTSFTKSRPKRACAIDRTTEDKKTGVCKLGKQKDGSWTLPIKSISLPMFQCPICNEYLVSPESRKTHEVREHSNLLEWLNNNKPVDIDSTPKNETCDEEQLTLFNYLKLCETSKHKTTAVHELAKRTNFLKALNSKGFKNMGDEIRGPKIVDFFKCNYCPFETNLIFALWTHQHSKHLYLKYESEKKPFLYCFLCKRTLNRRTQLLRHLDACIDKHSKLPITNNPPPPKRRHMCMFCDEGFYSLTEFEKHIWGHAKK